MGSIVAKYRGANDPDLPAFVGLAESWTSDVYGAGHMGSEYEPVKGLELAGKLNLPKGIEIDRLGDRNQLRTEFDRLRQDLDQHQTLERVDQLGQKAFEMVTSGRVQKAFDLSEESQGTRDLYGPESVDRRRCWHGGWLSRG